MAIRLKGSGTMTRVSPQVFSPFVAFVSVAPRGLVGSVSTSWTCSRHVSSRLSPRASVRRAHVSHVVCEAAPSSPQHAEEEESLDENAMRAAEIHEVLVGLEDFKARIVDDATKLAKKVRASKKDLKKSLENHPDIIKIDGHLAELRRELESLGDR